MAMLSCRSILICVTVRVACVASVWRLCPATVALDKKSETHAAYSASVRGGISDGGCAGSKVRLAKLTGCLLIVTAGGSLGGRLHERVHQLSKPVSAASNTEAEMKRRGGNDVSALILRARPKLKLRICGRG